MTSTELLLMVIAAQLAGVILQLQRVLPVLRSSVVASTRGNVYLAKLAALFKLTPPTDAELAAAAPAPSSSSPAKS